MKGREFVLPDDIKDLAVPVLAHRLSLAYAAQLEKNKEEAVIREILEIVTVPAEKIYV
jgi:MoxR-like ATPase